jgi:hypothetical protein
MPVNKNPEHILTLSGKNKLAKMHCLGDFLDPLGYQVVTYRAGQNDYGRLEPVLANHGLRNITSFPHDKDLFEAFNNTELKALVGKQPFVAYITTIDTRPPIAATCLYRAELYKGHKEYHAVDCIDQYLKGFFAKLAELNLTPHNTQIAIFGDGFRGDLNKNPVPLFKDPRGLFAMFPFAPKFYVPEWASLYDVAPTLLDLADIEFSPKFPFGGNIKTAPNGLPGPNEYTQVYKGLE